MAMPASGCPALQHCAMQSVDTLAVSPNSDKSKKQFLYSDGDPDHHQNLIICSLAQCQTFSENFMQIYLEVFAESC